MAVRQAKKKSKSASSSGFSLFDDGEVADADSDEELPRDEAGRQKIKQQYVDLLSIRLEKLKGRILNRERIDKNLEGIYFVCAKCAKVCHNLDEGLIEDEDNQNNICKPCTEASKAPPKPARAKAGRSKAAPKARTSKASKPAKKTKATKTTKAAKKKSSKKK